MSGYSFDSESVRRISRAVRRVEGLADTAPGFGAVPVSSTGGAQVRTPATFPNGYDGTQPVFGKLIERDRDGNIIELADCYIQGTQAGQLAADTVYLGRMERVYAGANGSAVLYRVQITTGGAGGFARCHPWRIQEIYTDEEYGAGSGTFWELIYADRFGLYYDDGTWDYWVDEFDAGDLFFLPPWPGSGLPLFGLSDTVLDLDFINPNGDISTTDRHKRESCYARIARFASGIGYPSYLGDFQKTRLYFKTPTGQKIYLSQAIYPDPERWGYQPYEYHIGLPFSVFGITKISTHEGRRFAILNDSTKDKYGVAFTYHLWFEDPFGLVKSNAGPNSPKRVLVTPSSSGGLLAGSALGGFGYGSASFSSSAFFSMRAPAYIVTNSSDQSLITSNPVT